jgi:peptidoglycan-associated lipoprotein
MSKGRLSAVLVSAVVVPLWGACAAHRAPAPAPGQPTLVVLLPDPETGITGAALVSNEFGDADLAAARDAVHARADRAPGPVNTIDEDEVERLFDTVLAALPPVPLHFTLDFLFESDELTDRSKALMPDILTAVKGHPAPEVAIVGHTDTMGEPDANVALGLKRAISIRRLLVDAGLEDSIVVLSSHGEADLLVKTPDETPEPRNRRVEIVVR